MKENPEEESMKSRANTDSYSPILQHCVVNLLGAIRTVVSIMRRASVLQSCP